MNNNSNITDPIYQSTFLPIFSKAETQIKKAICDAYLNKTSRFLLLIKIQAIIKAVDEKIPQDLKNREDYFMGIRNKAQKWINEFYDKPLRQFVLLSGALYTALITRKEKVVKIDTPMQLLNAIKEKKIEPYLVHNVLYEAKGHVRIPDYEKQLDAYINKLSQQTLTSGGTQRPVSLWQKAEIDIRHQKQMNMLKELSEQKVELAYLSSHPDCSERCEHWQGKLVSLTEHATMSGMRVRKSKKGEWIYSLTDIMAQTDKYGYQNNIINGFNCRHYLIPYEDGAPKPNTYDKRDIAKEREINGNLRKMEREIRELKARALLYSKANPKLSKQLTQQAKRLTARYQQYANENGFAWFAYRLKI